jgi:hypothetical protein
VKTELSADVLRNPPGQEPKVEGAFRKLCEALSMAEGTSEALGGWAHRDPDRLQAEPAT